MRRRCAWRRRRVASVASCRHGGASVLEPGRGRGQGSSKARGVVPSFLLEPRRRPGPGQRVLLPAKWQVCARPRSTPSPPLPYSSPPPPRAVSRRLAPRASSSCHERHGQIIAPGLVRARARARARSTTRCWTNLPTARFRFFCLVAVNRSDIAARQVRGRASDRCALKRPRGTAVHGGTAAVGRLLLPRPLWFVDMLCGSFRARCTQPDSIIRKVPVSWLSRTVPASFRDLDVESQSPARSGHSPYVRARSPRARPRAVRCGGEGTKAQRSHLRPSTVRSDEWPAWFSFWFSGCWRALAKGTAWRRGRVFIVQFIIINSGAI